MNVSVSIRLEAADEIDDGWPGHIAIGPVGEAAIHAKRPEDFERLAAACLTAANLLRQRDAADEAQTALTLADVSPEDVTA
jgi:hypothetical protein